MAWLRRSSGVSEATLRLDAALQQARHAQFSLQAPRNLSLHVHTSHVLQLEARGAAAARWPRLAPARAAAGLAGVGAAVPLRLRAANPSRSHALLLQPVLAPPPPGAGAAGGRWAPAAFELLEWRSARGAVRAWPAAEVSERWPLLLLAPAAELELELRFTPREPAALAAYLYLRYMFQYIMSP